MKGRRDISRLIDGLELCWDDMGNWRGGLNLWPQKGLKNGQIQAEGQSPQVCGSVELAKSDTQASSSPSNLADTSPWKSRRGDRDSPSHSFFG